MAKKRNDPTKPGGNVQKLQVTDKPKGKKRTSGEMGLNRNTILSRDYTGYGSFDNAFDAAKRAGEKEFVWNNNRYNTKSALSPAEQMETYGIEDSQRRYRGVIDFPYSVLENLGDMYTASGYDTPLSHVAGRALGLNESFGVGNLYDRYAAAEQDGFRLYMGLPQRYNTFAPSKYKKGAYEIVGYENLLPDVYPSQETLDKFGRPERFSEGDGHEEIKPFGDLLLGRHTVRGGKDKKGEYIEYIDRFDFDTYKPAGVPVGEAIDAVNKPYEIYGRKYYKDYGDGIKRTMYYSDEELMNLDTKDKNFDATNLQLELLNRGYSLPKSVNDNFDLDGVFGPETEAALLDWRKKNPKKKQYGGVVEHYQFGGETTRNMAKEKNPNKPKGKEGSKTGSGKNLRYQDVGKGRATKIYDADTDRFLGLYENMLPEVEVSAPMGGNFFDRYNYRFAQDNRNSGLFGSMFMTPVDYAMGFPQALATYAATGGEYLDPASAIGVDRNSLGGIGVNAVLDPSNIIGAGLVTRANRLGNIRQLLSRSKQLPGSGNVDNVIPYEQTVQNGLDNNATFINLARESSRPKSKMYKASEVVEDSDFNIKKIYRGDKEVPKVIKVQGKSGEWVVNRNSDGSYYFNAAMSSPFESGKAMIRINELLPPKPTLLEPNSLSLDSYLITLKLGKRPHWKMEFENYIPLNHSAINNKILSDKFGFKPEGTTVPFSSLEEANVALKEVNTMLKKQGITQEADVFSNGSGWYGIKIPNFKLTRDYKHGGIITPPAAITGAVGLQQYNSGGWIPTDPMGYWNPENIGRAVRIPSNRITMQGVNQPLLGISNTGDMQYMLPGGEYLFSGDSVTEYPLNNNDMNKKKKATKKQFGGSMPDLSKLTSIGGLLQGFKGSDPSSWMGQIQQFATENKYTVPTSQRASEINAGAIMGLRRGQMDKVSESLSGLLGMQDLFKQFTNQEGAGYNPMNYMVNPTRGFRYGGFVPTYQAGGLLDGSPLSQYYTPNYWRDLEQGKVREPEHYRRKGKGTKKEVAAAEAEAEAMETAAKDVSPTTISTPITNEDILRSPMSPLTRDIQALPVEQIDLNRRIPILSSRRGNEGVGFSGVLPGVLSSSDGDIASDINNSRTYKSLYLDDKTGMSVVRDGRGIAYIYNPETDDAVTYGEISDSNSSILQDPVTGNILDFKSIYDLSKNADSGFRSPVYNSQGTSIVTGAELFGGEKYPRPGKSDKKYKNDLIDFAIKYGPKQLFEKDYNMIKDSPEYKKALKKAGKVENKQFGGGIDTEMDMNLPVQIQAEKGEMISMPDNRIVPVMAKRRHKNMGDDEVTDILPPGSFVASRDKKMLLTKDDLANVNLGFGPMEYSEDGPTKLPKEMTAADVMSKYKQTPADILKDIAAKYPEVKRENDIFAGMANELNLTARQPYIAAVKYFTEEKKPDNQKNPEMAKYGYMIPTSQMSENPFTDKLGIKGMEFRRGGVVPKAQLGQLIAAGASASGNLFDTIGKGIGFFDTRKTLRNMESRGNRFFDQSLGELRGLQGRQMSNLGMGTFAAAVPQLLASSDFATPDRSGQFAALAATPQSVPRSYFDYQMSQARQGIRPYLSMASRNTANAAQAMNMAQASQANMLNSIGNIANQRAMQDLGMRQNYLAQLGALRGQTAAEEAQKLNYQTNFANQRLTNLGSIGSNYFNQASNIDTSGTYGRMNLESQRLGYINAIKQAQLENRQNLYRLPGQFMKGIASSASMLGGMNFGKSTPSAGGVTAMDAVGTLPNASTRDTPFVGINATPGLSPTWNFPQNYTLPSANQQAPVFDPSTSVYGKSNWLGRIPSFNEFGFNTSGAPQYDILGRLRPN